jgi:chemotaxis response regulator CheB
MAYKTITQAQLKNLDWLNQTGQSDFVKYESKEVNNLLEYYGIEFIKNVSEAIRQKELINSGKLSSSLSQKIVPDGSKVTLELYIADYYRFVDKGVKGVKSSKNAPDSPYKFKTLTGMSASGRASIKSLITNGKAKVRTITQSASRTEERGLKYKSSKSLIDKQTDTLIYMIKKYGIKKTGFFSDTFAKTFSTLEKDLAEALGYEVAINLIA